jgi:glycosyltransferase involved in cell wall biosynthesis
MVRVALLAIDARQAYREYHKPQPYFGTAPEALLQGFALVPDLEVHVVSCTQRPMDAPPKLADNIWFYSLFVPKLGWLQTGYQGCIRAVRRKLRTIQPAIVHGQGTERDCAMCAVWSGFPNVLTIHGNMRNMADTFKPRFGSFGWCAALLEDYALKRTGGVFCNSRFTEEMIRPRTTKTWLVPNALRESFFTRPRSVPREQPPVLLNVGVIAPNKRQLELLEIAGRLHAAGRQCQFWFAGQADPADLYAAEFLARIQVAHRQGYARYAGYLTGEQLLDCFDRACALVHFSKVETFGLVVAEALTRGLKLFAARCGGIVDIAEGVQDAELFEANDFAGLEQRIAQWLEQAVRPPANGAELMRQRYHPVAVARRHLEIYREIIDYRSSSATRSKQ